MLDPSEIPYDITFVIEECGSTVRAHKLIMAMGSPMCKKQFFGELREKKHEIVIESTTKDAFVTMVDFIYGEEVDWSKKTIEDLFDITNLAEKYQLDALKEEIEEAAKRFPFSEQNVVSSASTAEKFSQLFENLAETILMKCREFLSSLLVVREDFCEFADKYAETELAVVALKLVAGMKNVKPTVLTIKPTVKTCCQLKTCRRGKPMLNRSEFKVGDRVKIKPDAKDWAVTDSQRMSSAEGAVIDISSTNLICWREAGDWNRNDDLYQIKYDGAATFLFCKC